MTNEELVFKIKAGETDLITDLWLQIERFVKQQAYRFASSAAYSAHCNSAGVTGEDLYIAGYFALEPAIKNYAEDSTAGFLSYFGRYHLKAAFYKELGIANRGGKKWSARPDALFQAISFEAPAYKDKDGNETSLENLLVDPEGQQALEDIEDKLYIYRLHVDLEKALESLRPRDAQIIRDHYYNQLTLAEQSKKHDLSLTRVRDIRLRALAVLRKHWALKDYRESILYSISGTGFQVWKNSGMSQPERIVAQLDDYERMLGLK